MILRIHALASYIYVRHMFTYEMIEDGENATFHGILIVAWNTDVYIHIFIGRARLHSRAVGLYSM